MMMIIIIIITIVIVTIIRSSSNDDDDNETYACQSYVRVKSELAMWALLSDTMILGLHIHVNDL